MKALYNFLNDFIFAIFSQCLCEQCCIISNLSLNQGNLKQEVGANFSVCILYLQIVKEKTKSLDHVIKGSCDFMEGSSSLYKTTLPGLVAIGIVAVETKCF